MSAIDWPGVLDSMISAATVSAVLAWALIQTASSALWQRLKPDQWLAALRIATLFIAILTVLSRFDVHTASSPCLGGPESKHRTC